MDSRSIIVEHYNNPRNKKNIKNSNYLKENTRNSSCIDNLDIYLKLKNNVIEDIAYDGEACAISISSASIMSENLKGKTIEEAKLYIENVFNMLNNLEFDKELIKEAIVYEITKNTCRKTCAWLPYEGIKKIINKI